MPLDCESMAVSSNVYAPAHAVISSFLNDTERIASWNYQPTDDDVIRARLRTLGVQEYKFVLSHGMCCALITTN